MSESEAQFRIAASTSPVMIWIAGLDKECTWFNAGWLHFTGRRLEEELGHGWSAGVHAEDLDRCVRTYSEAFDRREAFEIEYRLRRHDGTYRWVLDRGAPLHQPDGEFCGYIGGCLDVHERVVAEQALQSSQNQLRRVTDALPALVAYVDAEERYRYVNHAYAELSPHSPEDIVGQRLEEVHGPSEYQAIRPHVDAVLRGEARRFELRVQREGNEDVRLKDVSYVPQRLEDDGVAGFFLLGVDVTERKRAEMELRRQARQQTALAALGQEALFGCKLQPLCESAVAAVAAVLDVEFSQVLDVLPGREELLLRAGVGWKPGLTGKALVSAALDSPPGYALLKDAPVVVKNLRADTRFCGPSLLTEHGVVSGMCCTIAEQSERPWGVLGAYTRERRIFSRDEVSFLQVVAKMLAAAIRRENLERSAHRLGMLVESSHEAIIGFTPEQIITSWNRAAEELYGYSAAEVLGRHQSVLVAAERQAEVDERFAELQRGVQSEPFETVRLTKDHRLVDVEMTLLPVLDELGRTVAVMSMGRDITDRKRTDRQVQMVIGELGHRMKNAVATIDAIAHQTIQYSSSLDEFKAAFSQRLRALGQVHTLLIGTQWEGASLTELLEMELAARCPDRQQMTMRGPAVKLRPEVALALHMVIHELCTNAAKYGALSCQQGQVRVLWSVLERSGREHMRLRWRERGGPAVAAPSKRGFGSTILESTIPYELEGELKLEFRPRGLLCKMLFPLVGRNNGNGNGNGKGNGNGSGNGNGNGNGKSRGLAEPATELSSSGHGR